MENGRGVIDHRPLKSGVSHKCFDEMIERFLHVDSDRIIFGLMTILLYICDISTRNGSPSFARACFYIKLLHIFLKILVFRCIATCTEQELFRVITTSCSIYSEKCKYEFSNIKFCF